MTIKIDINLPPSGLIIRDFILTTFAHICRETDSEMVVSPTEVNIYAESINDLAKAYINILDDLSLPPRGLYPRGKKTLNALSPEKFREHKEWIKADYQRIKELTDNLANIEWSGPSGGRVISIGKKPQIAAPLLFKVNYYAGKRVFLSPHRYQNADIRMDEHSLLFTCVGTALSRIRTLRIDEKKRATVYVSVLEPGAMELHKALAEVLRDVQGQLSPDVIFRVLIGFKLRISGIAPLHIMMVSEGRQRPTLLFSHEVSVEKGISRFVENLRGRSQNAIIRLLSFTLKNWRTADKSQRTIIRVGFELAQSIYMVSTGAVRPADMTYHLARSTYATTSDEFSRSLTEARNSPIRSLETFKKMIIDVEEALERCLAL